MKYTLFLFIFIFKISYAQKRIEIEEFSDGDGLAWNKDLKLYSDSSFLFFYGSDTYVNFIIGRFERNSDTIRLFPKSKIDLPKITYHKADSCRTGLEVNFLYENTDTIKISWALLDTGVYYKILQMKDIPYNNYTRKFYDSSIVIMDGLDQRYIKYRKPKCADFDVVFTELESVYDTFLVFPIEKNVYKIDVELGIPKELHFFLQLSGFLSYKIPVTNKFMIKGQYIEIN